MQEIDISQEALLSSLVDVPMFSNFSRGDLIDAVELCKIYSYRAGESIIEEGSSSSALYTIISGSVDIIKKTLSEGSVKLNSLGAGAVFGETSLFLTEPASATVKAREDTIVMALPRKLFSDYITSHPKSGLVFLTYVILDLLRKLRSCNETIVYEKERTISPDDLEAIHYLLPFTMGDIISESE